MHAIQIAAAVIVFATALPALAKDVSREQSAVAYARQQFEQAAAEYGADADQAATTGKALQSLKKQFEQEQKKARLSETKKQQAKDRLDKAEKALDRAWKQ